MNLSSPSTVRSLLMRHGLHSRKQLGQHFLVDANVLRRIVEVAELPPGGLSLEIGPGLGVLTQELSAASALVCAIEYDRMLLPVLEETALSRGNVRIIQADAARLLKSTPLPVLFSLQPGLPGLSVIGPTGNSQDPEAADAESGTPPTPEPSAIYPPAGEASITCVSNLPYNITSPAITLLLGQKQWLRSLVLMIQAEVADRLVAAPGTESYGALSVFVQYHSRVTRELSVGRNCFLPAPAVDSAVVRIIPVAGGTVPVDDPDRLFQVSRALFGQRRKTSLKALQSLPGHPSRETIAAALEQAGIAPAVRGEDLSVAEIASIADHLPISERPV